MTITLSGAPVSTNHVWKHVCRGGLLRSYLTADGRALKESYQWEARSQFHGKPLTDPLAIRVTLYFPDKRRRDWDNWHKVPMDALNGIVWEDDSQIQIATVRKRYDKENPRIEVQLLPTIDL